MTGISSDDSTVLLLKEQGIAGLAKLLSFERKQLKNVVQRHLGADVSVRVDSSDVIQDVFLGASRMLDSYLVNPRLPPLLWLRGLAKRITKEKVRHHVHVAKRTVESEVRESRTVPGQMLVNELSTSMPTPGTQLAQVELQQRVSDIVASMKAQDRQILYLIHFEDNSLREASELLEITYEAAKKRYARAIDRLKQISESKFS